MAKIHGLQRRRNAWYLRVRIPQDLLLVYKPQTEIVQSLKTSDYSVACKRIHIERANVYSEFDEKRQQMKAAVDEPDMLSGFVDYELEGVTLRWLVDVENRAKAAPAKREAWLKREGIEDIPQNSAEILATLEDDMRRTHEEVIGLSDDAIHYGMDSAAKYLKERKITFDTKSAVFKQLGNMFSKANYEMALRSLRLQQGRPYAPSDAIFMKHMGGGVAQAALSSGIKKKITVKQLFAEYMKDPKKVRVLSTQKNYLIILRALEEQFGSDKYVHEITQEDVEQIRDLLLHAPTNAKKMAPGKTLKAASDLAVIYDWPLISRATVNVHLSKLNAVMAFAKHKRYILENPATGLLLEEKDSKKDKRNPFDTAQLQAIFSAPLYKGCVDDENGYNKVGKNYPRRARFWVPLISLYTGMRLNEICQLEIADVVEHDNVNVIFIREESEDGNSEKQVKTPAGIRYIPVHPELKKMGLMEYVVDMKKAGHKRLFPDLKKSPLGYFSVDFSKWFGRFLINVGVKKKKTSFHSFRHNFRDAMSKALVPHDYILLLGGWSGESVDSRYGGGNSSIGITANDVYNQLIRIEYKDLDLSHLYLKEK